MQEPTVCAFRQRLGPVTDWFLTQEAGSSLLEGEDWERGLGLTCAGVTTCKSPPGHVTLPSDCTVATVTGVPGLVPCGQSAVLSSAEEPLEGPGSGF